MKRFIMILALLFCTMPLLAKVRGAVVHAENSAAYPGVEVTLVHANGQKYVAYTDSTGMFYLSNVPPGSATLQVHSANETKRVPVQVTTAEKTDLGPISVR
jgi:hypothetical protein